MTIDSAYFFETHEVSTVDPVYFFGHESIGIPTIKPWVTYTDENGVFVSRAVQTTEYTITFGGESPIYWRGRVNILDTELTLPGDDTILYFFRKTTIDQQYGFGDTTKFPSERVEFGVDKLTLILQEIEGNKCGCDGGGVNEAPDPGGNAWPGIAPPVAGPEPNPYAFPDNCCSYFRDSYRFQSGAELTGDYDFAGMLEYLDPGETFGGIDSDDGGGPYLAKGDDVGLLLSGEASLTRQFVEGPCREYSAVKLQNSGSAFVTQVPTPLAGSFGVTLFPANEGAYDVFRIEHSGNAGGRLFRGRAGTTYSGFGTSWALFADASGAGAANNGTDFFDLPQDGQGRNLPLYLYCTWARSEVGSSVSTTITIFAPQVGRSVSSTWVSSGTNTLDVPSTANSTIVIGYIADGSFVGGTFYYGFQRGTVMSSAQQDAMIEAVEFDCMIDRGDIPEPPCESPVITQLTPPSSFEVESFPFLLNMSVTATGTAPLEYRWKFNGSFINGETSSTFSKTLNDENDVGNYSAWVSNECTQVPAENGINITYNPAPVCTPVTLTPLDPPTYAATGIGDSVEWFAEAAGTPPFTYEWFKDSVSIPGATTAFYTAVYNSANDLGTYECLVTNACGVDSSSADLTTACVPVDVAPLNPSSVNIIGYPQDIQWTATLNAGTEPVSYQWRFFPEGGGGFEDIPGETNATFSKTVTDTSGLGSYAVTVTNACGSDSASAGVFEGPV